MFIDGPIDSILLAGVVAPIAMAVVIERRVSRMGRPVKAMQWCGEKGCAVASHGSAQDIVEWVNANGGDASFRPDPTICYGEDCPVDHGGDTIEIRTRGNAAYAEMGDYVVMRSEGLPADLFLVVDPATYELRRRATSRR